jgi:hypothetical protein
MDRGGEVSLSAEALDPPGSRKSHAEGAIFMARDRSSR